MRLRYFFVFLGMLFLSSVPSSVKAVTPTPPPSPTATQILCSTPTSIIPTSPIGTPVVIGTPEVCRNPDGSIFPCPTRTAVSPTLTVTSTSTPSVTPTVGSYGFTCTQVPYEFSCFTGLRQTYTGDVPLTVPLSNNAKKLIATISMQGAVTSLEVYYEFYYSWTGADPRYKPVVGGFYSYTWGSGYDTQIIQDSCSSATPSSEGNCVRVGRFLYTGGAQPTFDFYMKNVNISWGAGNTVAGGRYTITVNGTYSTPTPTLSVSPTPTLDPCTYAVVDTEGWFTPPYVRPGACYTLIPGGDWEIPDEVVDIVAMISVPLPTSISFGGWRLCIDYLVFEAELFGVTYSSIVATGAFIFSLTLLYREFRS